MRVAVNLLFTGDPATTTGLAKVLEAVGLPDDKPVLHPQHPVVVGTEGPFVLCPADTNTTSSLTTTSVVNTQFVNMLGKSFCLIRLIGLHLIFLSQQSLFIDSIQYSFPRCTAWIKPPFSRYHQECHTSTLFLFFYGTMGLSRLSICTRFLSQLSMSPWPCCLLAKFPAQTAHHLMITLSTRICSLCSTFMWPVPSTHQQQQDVAKRRISGNR